MACAPLHYATRETEHFILSTFRPVDPGWSMEWITHWGDTYAQDQEVPSAEHALGDFIGIESQLCWIERASDGLDPCAAPGHIQAQRHESSSTLPLPLLAVTVKEIRRGPLEDGAHQAHIKKATLYFNVLQALAGRELDYGKLSVRLQAYPNLEGYAELYLSSADHHSKIIVQPGAAPQFALHPPLLLATLPFQKLSEPLTAPKVSSPQTAKPWKPPESEGQHPAKIYPPLY
jgi:hypothetical protein